VAPTTNGRVDVPGQGFSVVLPKTWATIEVDGTANQDGMRRLFSQVGVNVTSAQADRFMQSMRAALPGGVKFIAVKPSTFDLNSLFVSTSVIMRSPAEAANLNLLESRSALQLAVLGSAVSGVQHKQVKLANGKALWFSFSQKAAIGGTEREAHTVMYVFLHGDDEFVVLFSTLAAPTTPTQKEFATMAGSLTFLANADAAG
jgi:hypothetical protein